MTKTLFFILKWAFFAIVAKGFFEIIHKNTIGLYFIFGFALLIIACIYIGYLLVKSFKINDTFATHISVFVAFPILLALITIIFKSFGIDIYGRF